MKRIVVKKLSLTLMEGEEWKVFCEEHLPEMERVAFATRWGGISLTCARCRSGRGFEAVGKEAHSFNLPPKKGEELTLQDKEVLEMIKKVAAFL